MMWKYKKLQELERMERIALIISLFVILGLLLLVLIPYAVYEKMYSSTIYPGVVIEGVSVGGMTTEQATQTLELLLNNFDQQGVQFSTSEKTVTIKPTMFALEDPDLTYELMSFDIPSTVTMAYSVGRNDSFIANVGYKIRTLFHPTAVSLQYRLERTLFLQALQLNFEQLENKGSNAYIVFQNNTPIIMPEQNGTVYNFEKALDDMQKNFSLVHRDPITIESIVFEPVITRDVIEGRVEELTQFIADAKPLQLTYEGNTWEFPISLYREYIEFMEVGDGEIALRVDPLQAQSLFDDAIKTLTIEPKNAEITLSEDNLEVLTFKPQQPGRKVQVDESITTINRMLFEEEGSPVFEVALVVETAEAEVQLADLNELGIRELIGVGSSDYSGSPANRRHNVEVGRNSFNGVLLAPGEEFSSLKFIGPVDGAHGYLEELVIKGNETIPEYGGGLCQVTTTMFRAALDAGLKITERRNHSYTVRYYEPIGTDATIYSPAPDFKFLNDTEHHILIHTINDTRNSRLIYEIWGTRDGRTVELTKPVTYGWTPAPPTKIVETTDLPPGVKKCTESAHAGVKAYFDRIITLSDGTVNEERFHSNYRPWQAVCLVGVEEVTVDVPTDTSPEEPEPVEDTESEEEIVAEVTE